jgi:hypothetical protein
MTNSFRWKAALIIFVAIFVRSAFVVAVDKVMVKFEFNPDSLDCLSCAHNLATQRVSTVFAAGGVFGLATPALSSRSGDCFSVVAWHFVLAVAAGGFRCLIALSFPAHRFNSFRGVAGFDCRSRIRPLSASDHVLG